MSTNVVANTQASDITRFENFRLPNMVMPGEFSVDELSEDMAGVHMSFPRIKIPAGGALQFEIPGESPENPDYTKFIEGIIVYNHPAGSYWSNGGYDSDENSPPDCSSIDGINGSGIPGGACAVCPYNAWGSGPNGKGKACKNMRSLYILQDGEFIPTLIMLPPTSLRPYGDFAQTHFATRRRAAFGSVIQIGLRRENNGKDDYSIATFRKLYDFSGEQLAAVRLYSETLRSQVKEILVQQAIEAENRAETADYITSKVADADFSGTAKRLAASNVAAGDLPA